MITTIGDNGHVRMPSRRRWWWLAAMVAIAMAATLTPQTAHADELPQADDAHGISVQGVSRAPDTDRSYDYLISSDRVTGDGQTTYGLALRVTLPEDYFSTDKSYPVVYVYDDMSGNYRNWTERGDLESLLADTDVIGVSVEGGVMSWYTDWQSSNGWDRKNDWRTFHNEQVVPFIDHNLRTQADREHRGIIGFSMGGFGAMRYAQQYPELYSYVTAISSGQDLADPTFRTGILLALTLQAWNPAGPFGPTLPDTGWDAQNPLSFVDQLQDTTVGLYAGEGANATDLLEQTAAATNRKMSRALDEAGIDHRLEILERNSSYGGYTCSGGHSWECVSLVFAKERQRMLERIG